MAKLEKVKEMMAAMEIEKQFEVMAAQMRETMKAMVPDIEEIEVDRALAAQKEVHSFLMGSFIQ